MNHVSIPKDPDSSVQLRPLVDFRDNSESLCVVRFGNDVDDVSTEYISRELGDKWLKPGLTVSIHEKSR